MKLDAANAAPDSWERRTVGEACERITSGGTPSRREPLFYEGGTVPWVKTKELNDGVILEAEELITERALASSSAKLLPPGTILLAMYGATVGMLGVLGKPMACNQACCALIPGADTDRDYLYYQLLAHREQLQGLATGAAQQNLSGAQIKQLVLPFPSLYEQRSIGRTLRILDDRITLLRETNATLEAIAQALFKSWFVDFDPVRAKMAGRAPEGMDHVTAALFPDGLEETALGLVPKSWRLGQLDDLLVLQRGFDLPAQDRTAGTYPIIAASGLSGTHHEAMVKGPGVVTGRSGVLGRVFLTFDDYWPLNTTLWIKEFRAATACYAYELLRLLDFKSFNAGSAVPTLNRNHIHGLPYVIPAMVCVEAFESIARPLHERVKDYEQQAQTLGTLRDTLLPRLISGQLRLPEAQHLIEEAC
jgi:type I restriction enzyme S subunit